MCSTFLVYQGRRLGCCSDTAGRVEGFYLSFLPSQVESQGGKAEGVGLTQRAMVFIAVFKGGNTSSPAVCFTCQLELRHLCFDVQGWPAAQLLPCIAKWYEKHLIQSQPVFINRTKKKHTHVSLLHILKAHMALLTCKLAF